MVVGRGDRRAGRPRRACGPATDDDLGWLGGLAAVVVRAGSGWSLGGAVAARHQRVGAPLTHGILAAVALFVIVQGIGIVRAGRHRRRHRVGRVAVERACSRIVAGAIGGVIGGRVGSAVGASRGGRDVSVLVIDVGTSGLRAAVVRPDAAVDHVALPAVPARHAVRRASSSSTPAAMAERGARGGRRAPLAAADRSRPSASPTSGPPRSCGTGPPASRSGPALGWQDLRTIGDCLDAGRQGPAPGAEPVGHQAGLAARHLRPRPRRATCASAPSTPGSRGRCRRGTLHVTDRSNAGVTGLLRADGIDWDDHVLDVLRIPAPMLPDARRLERRASARRRRCRARRRSPASSATSRRR